MTDPTVAGQARYDRYAAAKTNLAETLGTYLAAVIDLGGDDAAASLELARQMLIRDLNDAVDRRLLTVPLTDVWEAMTGDSERSDRGSA